MQHRISDWEAGRGLSWKLKSSLLVIRKNVSGGLKHSVKIAIGDWEKSGLGTSLVVKWLRICLPMQGTRVRALLQEDSHMPRSN